MASYIGKLIKLWEAGALLLDKSLQLFVSLVLFGLMTITCIDVIGRYLFDNPLIGSVELTELLMGCLIFSSLPIITWRREHINVDITDAFIPLQVKKARNHLFNIVIAISLFVIGKKVWDLASRSQRYDEITEYLEIPIYYFTYFFAVTCWLTAIASIVLVLTEIFNKQYKNQG
jgi:TRAP-type transport system small permease protein